MRLAEGGGRSGSGRRAVHEIETDKTVSQIKSSESGVLKKQLFEAGDEVEVLAPVAILETK